MNWWVLRRRIHVSWLVAVGCVGVLGGVFLAQFGTGVFFASASWLIVIFLLGFYSFWRHRVYSILAILVAGVLLGLWRGSLSVNQLTAYAGVYDAVVTVEGHVKDDIDGNNGQTVMRLDGVKIGGREMPGSLWISSSSSQDIKRGDEVTVNGKIAKGFGSFAGVMYQATIKKIVVPSPGDTARIFRDWFADLVRQAIPDPEASLGIGYLVGQKRALPADLSEALRIAGLTHVVVASGYNLTILVRLARRLLVKVSKYLATVSASVMIASFILVTGASPSMARAGFVAGVSLAAWYYGRKFHPLILLSLAIGVTVLIDPSYAWGDMGWQLSFAAFGGVMILAPLLQRYFFGDTKPGVIRQILGETLSAQIVTAPILIAGFGQLSNVAMIANLLVLPLVPLAMLLTFIAGIGALILPSIATVIGLLATWLLGYMINVAKYLAGLPWATTSVELSWVGLSLCYGAIIGVCFYLWRATKYSLRDANIIE